MLLLDCDRCSLRQSCSQVVVPCGNATATIMIVGESANGEEDLLGTPFVSREGDMLKKILRAAGIDERECYFTLAIKCRPLKSVTALQMRTCGQWLPLEVSKVKPRVIIALGQLPMRTLLGLPGTARLVDYAGEFYRAGLMAPAGIGVWVSAYKILNGGKKLYDQSVSFFQQVKEKVLEEVVATCARPIGVAQAEEASGGERRFVGTHSKLARVD